MKVKSRRYYFSLYAEIYICRFTVRAETAAPVGRRLIHSA